MKAEVSMVRIMLLHLHCLIVTVLPLAPIFVHVCLILVSLRGFKQFFLKPHCRNSLLFLSCTCLYRPVHALVGMFRNFDPTSANCLLNLGFSGKPLNACTAPPLEPARTDCTAHILITQTGELKVKGKIHRLGI